MCKTQRHKISFIATKKIPKRANINFEIIEENKKQSFEEIEKQIDDLYPFDTAASLCIPFEYNQSIKQILFNMLQLIKEVKQDGGSNVATDEHA